MSGDFILKLLIRLLLLLGRCNVLDNRMNKMFLAFGFVTSSCYANQQHSENLGNMLLGQWIFNKPETIKNFRNSDLSESEFKKFSSILKPAW